MPRIIKEAPVKEKKIVCDHCGRTIAYVKKDIREYHGTDISGGPDGCSWIVCPGKDCGKDIILKSW